MNIILYGIKNCDTMKKARAWLEQHGVQFHFHDYKASGIERKKVARWCELAGWEVLLNRTGTTFRKLPEHDKLDLDERKAIDLMLANPSMIKRPVLEVDGNVIVGFKPEEYARQRVLR